MSSSADRFVELLPVDGLRRSPVQLLVNNQSIFNLPFRAFLTQISGSVHMGYTYITDQLDNVYEA